MDLENLEKLVQQCPYVPRKEMEILREISQFSSYSDVVFEKMVKRRNMIGEYHNRKGRESVIAGPIVQLLSVHFLPSSKTTQLNKQLTIFGEIYAELCDSASGKTIDHDLFCRKCDDAQVLGPSGGPLTLTGPDCSDWPLPYDRNTRIVVDVFVGEEASSLFGEQQFCCAEDEETTITDLEAKELEFVHGDLGSLFLRYVAMPFAVYGQVRVEFCRKKSLYDVGVLYGPRCVDVKGKIVARYGGGNNPSQVCCTLFEKEFDSEFERVEFARENLFARMRLCRCWMGLPAYSSLVLDVDLSEFGTERKLVKETMELRVGNTDEDNQELIVDDDIFLHVSVVWVSPTPQGRQESYDMELEENESSDEEMSSGDEEMTEASCFRVASSFNLVSNWALRAHQSIEVFSVFVGQENFKPLQVYGSIVVSSDACAFYVFKRETKEDAFGLSEHCKTIPILDGSRAYEDALKMEFDLKDVESRLHIRGYTDWEERRLQEGSSWLDKQLCSVVPGQNGCFAAIHYTIFSKTPCKQI